MQILKDLYYHYSDSKDCAILGEMPEIKAAFAEIQEWAKHFDKDDYLKFEELILAHGAANELQGFVYGFRYGVRLMIECLPEGGASNG